MLAAHVEDDGGIGAQPIGEEAQLAVSVRHLQWQGRSGPRHAQQIPRNLSARVGVRVLPDPYGQTDQMPHRPQGRGLALGAGDEDDRAATRPQM